MTTPFLFDPSLPTCVLFVGGGQDSVALLMMYMYSTTFRNHFVGKANFVAIMADTGAEYPDTIVYVEWLRDWCHKQGIDFTLVSPEMGFHGDTWQSLQAQMERNDNIMGVAFPKSCTDNLKVKVSYRFLGQWLREHYGYTGSDAAVFYQYRHYFGKLVTHIGFASGEESRACKSTGKQVSGVTETVLFDMPATGPAYIPKWRKLCVVHYHPLIELGYDRAACQVIIASFGHHVPMPSNCMYCPYQNEPEIVYLYRAYPERWLYWVEREAAKLTKFADRKLNFGVKGKLTLEQYLEKALIKYGDWTLEQLREYRFSHGHCVGSKF